MDTNTGLCFRTKQSAGPRCALFFHDWHAFVGDDDLVCGGSLQTMSYCMSLLSKASSGEMTLYANKHCLETTHCLSLRSLELFQGQDGLNHDGWNDDTLEKERQIWICNSARVRKQVWKFAKPVLRPNHEEWAEWRPRSILRLDLLVDAWPVFSFQQSQVENLEWMLRKD